MGVYYRKTQAFVAGSKHMTSANGSISASIHEHIIELVSSQTHIEIIVDKNLTWKKQIDLV